MATNTSSSVVRTPVGHEDLIHDAQLDYYGLRLATCSSDRLVKVFNVNSENGAAPKIEFVCDLMGHTGPVWEVAWGNPRWGTLLASCGYEGLVIVHRLSEANVWEEIYRFSAKGSMNSIEWCPFEYGLAVACASSDGFVYILRCDPTTGEWACETSIQAHPLGCNAVTWAPYGALGSLTPDGRWVLRIASGGADSKVKLFRCIMDQNQGPQWDLNPETELISHKQMVRDVAWAPSIGLPYNLVASCSEDGSVSIWSQETENGQWAREDLPDFKAPVWRVAWSVTGSLLAVSSGDADVTLWKESPSEKRWIKISEVKDKTAAGTALSEPNAPAKVHVEPSKPRSESLDRTAIPQTAAPAAAAQPTPEEQQLLQPQTTWEGLPQQSASENPAVESESNQQPAAEPQVEQAAHETQDASQQHDQASADQQQQQQGEAATGGEYGAYDPNQHYAYDVTQQSQQEYYAQEGGYYDPSQQQQAWDGQQYAAEGEQGAWDQQQPGGGWGDQQQQPWDPNQQQQQWDPQTGQYWGGEHQPSGEGGAYTDTTGQGSWDYSQQQQQGLAAPPTYAGAMSQPNQPPPQWGAANQGQQSWVRGGLSKSCWA